MKLRSKLLFSFIVVALTLVAVMFFTLRWSFERGASTRMKQEHQAQLQQLAAELADYYSQTGSWREFHSSPERWMWWLGQHDNPFSRGGMGRQPQAAPDRFDAPFPGDAPLPSNTPMPAPPGRPYFLLDAGRQRIAGLYDGEGVEVPIEVVAGGQSQTVGYIGLSPPPSRLREFRRTPLAARYSQLLMGLTIGAVVMSVAIAVPLSGRLTRRILKLHSYVRTLADGDYDQRVQVPGRDELAGLANHLNRLADALATAKSQRQQLTADISHELRTPVATLQANIEAMQDGVLPMDDDSLASLHEQVRRLCRLIEDLYQLSLADVGGLRYQMEVCDLWQLLEGWLPAYQSLFERDGLTLSWQAEEGGDWTLLADPARMHQVFINLLENSRRYTDAPGCVSIGLARKGGEIWVTIEDSAPGVDSAVHHRLTDRLYRVDPSRNRASGGAGLGLNLCDAIVAAHHGRLMVGESHLGGLAVTVQLPALEG